MNTQYGYRKNRSTSDALGVAKRTIELAERAGQKGLKIPLDWEKAFDRITQEWLFKALEDFAIPEESMGSIKSRYEKPQFHVNIQGVKSKNGKTGDMNKARMSTIPPLLLILVMDRVLEIVPQISREHKRKVRIQRRRQSRRKMNRRSHKQNRNSKLYS